MSAAKADPDTIASAVANKAIFFIIVPITFQTQSDFRRPRGKPQSTATKSLQTRLNLKRLPKTVKQKIQTSADFLGVLAVSRNVVGACCIWTTISGCPDPSLVHLGHAGRASDGGERITCPQSRAIDCRIGPTKKGRGNPAAAFCRLAPCF
jgi:hypothetical protein